MMSIAGRLEPVSQQRRGKKKNKIKNKDEAEHICDTSLVFRANERQRCESSQTCTGLKSFLQFWLNSFFFFLEGGLEAIKKDLRCKRVQKYPEGPGGTS